ncbi:MAG: HEPN domain-containing protein [Acidimicrobiaceae bacterium]|nr:HEPN domain-containing protein [Acidimicrobiaceae bacterium]
MAAQTTDNARSAVIAGVFSRAQEFSEGSEVKADYTRHLCVLVTGYLEQEIVRIVVDYVDALGNQTLSRYVSDTLEYPGSMRAANILKLVRSFSDTWHSQLDEKLTIRHREAIGSLYVNRNLIAHGKDVDLTYLEVQEYYELAREVVRFVEEVVV